MGVAGSHLYPFTPLALDEGDILQDRDFGFHALVQRRAERGLYGPLVCVWIAGGGSAAPGNKMFGLSCALHCPNYIYYAVSTELHIAGGGLGGVLTEQQSLTAVTK